MMKTNLKNFPEPIDGRPTVDELKYVEWKRGFEKQLRKRQESIRKSLKTAVMPVKVGYEWELGLIKQILGE